MQGVEIVNCLSDDDDDGNDNDGDGDKTCDGGSKASWLNDQIVRVLFF